jgi:hypothetical protein
MHGNAAISIEINKCQELSNVKHSNLNFIENVQIDNHYAQCITFLFEQHLDKF